MIEVGLERCLREPPAVLAGARFGLVMNQASVDRNFRLACDVLAERFPGRLRALFSPQHGLWGEQQANMVESPHGWYGPLQIPIYSLYAEQRKPTPAMLDGLDCLVVDLQDVGTRVYTFIWTVSYCLAACADLGLPLVVLDRPNPLGGEMVEGPLLEPAFASFVGRTPLPMRHALTLGELTLLVREQLGISAEVHVVPATGWRRGMLFADTGRTWILPSPNMPRIETAWCYPGQVLLEGTNLSEGRGTTIPFEIVGAPYVEPWQLCEALERHEHPGLYFRPVWFVPTFDKWRGLRCGGVAWQIVEPRLARPFTATLAVLASVQRLWPHEFTWLPPPYEYESIKMPIDILYGSAHLRERLVGADAATVAELATVDAAAWHDRTAAMRLYPPG
ncbi:MAG: exo-beta-N-acetylmuramidase NamZ domain-containing protein [Pirellulaceae bacterium]